jgi:3D (Asp-Asp-Asp) domain-containing protein
MLVTNIVTATITAYCACKEVCTKGTEVTANGQRPVQGVTIAASRSIPFGSKVIVPSSVLLFSPLQGSNNFTVQDRLAKRYDSRFDIYFTKHSDAKNFGIKTNQTVTIITTK